MIRVNPLLQTEENKYMRFMFNLFDTGLKHDGSDGLPIHRNW